MGRSIRSSLSDLSSELKLQVLELHSFSENIVLMLLVLISFLLVLLLLHIYSACFFRRKPSEDPLRLQSVDKAYISSLPVSGYKSGEHEAGVECAVCLSMLEDDGTAMCLTECKHSFHIGCIEAWLRLRPICPVCRTPVELGEGLAVIGSMGEGRQEWVETPGEMVEGSSITEVRTGFGCDVGMLNCCLLPLLLGAAP